MNSGDKVIYIHIPKCGGTYVINVLYGTNNLNAHHTSIRNYDIRNKTVLATIRHPISFYNSFYNFLKFPNHPIRNPMKYIVEKYDDINVYTEDLLNKTFILNRPLNMFDTFYMKSNNKYGLLTNYILFFFDYRGDHSEKDIYKFMGKLVNDVKFIKMEDNLSEQLIKFSKENNIQLYEEFLDKKINANVKNQLIENHDLKKLIYEKDRPIFDIFNYELDKES